MHVDRSYVGFYDTEEQFNRQVLEFFIFSLSQDIVVNIFVEQHFLAKST